MARPRVSQLKAATITHPLTYRKGIITIRFPKLLSLGDSKKLLHSQMMKGRSKTLASHHINWARLRPKYQSGRDRGTAGSK